MTLFFKILATEEWRAAEAAGAFAGSAVDQADGFIHLSTAEQAAETAAKWFAGRDDLTLVAVDAAALGADLVWESSRGDALFPHLYTTLPLSAVVWSRPLPLSTDGRSRSNCFRCDPDQELVSVAISTTPKPSLSIAPGTSASCRIRGSETSVREPRRRAAGRAARPARMARSSCH